MFCNKKTKFKQQKELSNADVMISIADFNVPEFVWKRL
jgi:hypothetical protein